MNVQDKKGANDRLNNLDEDVQAIKMARNLCQGGVRQNI